MSTSGSPAAPLRVSNPLSHAPVRVVVVRNVGDETVASAQATGFLWRDNNALYLITNWHIVTGWDPLRDQPLSPTGFVPTHVEFDFVLKLQGPDDGVAAMRRTTKVVDLCDPSGAPRWLEHPSLGKTVDVVALAIGPDDVEIATQPINTFRDWVDFGVTAGDDAFVLGYPKGLTGGHHFPIWKRASIASEPDVDIDGLPKMFVDTATREGMSGSPVVIVSRGMTQPGGATPGLSLTTIIGTASQFGGVYSGRVDDDPLGAQIGIVWKPRVIGEIVQGQVRVRPPV